MFKDGIKVLEVKNPQGGFEVCKNILYKNVSKNTLLFLSGGSTPKTLYELLAKEKKLNAGAVAMVDERYLLKSKMGFTNEKMIIDTGLVQSLEKKNISFYPILGKNLDIQNTALHYDETVRFLFGRFTKSVGILGIGTDGHTAGIRTGLKINDLRLTNNLVLYLDDFPGEFKQRITLTFSALSKLDLLIVLVFGKEKKKALELMFSNRSNYEIPARFFKAPGIAQKTILITDLNLL